MGLLNFELCVLVPDRLAPISTSAVKLSLWHGVPAEVELPVEAAPSHVRSGDVLKRVVADHVYDWARHSSPG